MPQVQRFPMGIPYGWFFVGYCDELATGEVRPLHYFGRDLVMFRNGSGRAVMLDAHCPHLGAHIGYGGKVDGELIRCPFHGWGYDADGYCKDIPYAKVTPPVCRREPVIGSYPVREANGVIWCWYHPHDIQPLFDVAVYPEFTDPAWARQTRFEWRCAINPQEVAENGIDTAHFAFVHETPAVPEGASSYEGHVRRTGSDGWREIDLPDGGSKRIATSIRTVMNGAGQKITMLQGVATVWLLVLVTPIEADDAEIRFCFTHPVAQPGSAEEAALQQACASIAGAKGVIADLPIWQHKIHRAKPLLCDGDGQILRFRQYFQQFYAAEREPEKVAAE
ncbi:MAG TPA: Rieske 2Fe-2S domain-containing protein [Phenylobacterium sp.]